MQILICSCLYNLGQVVHNIFALVLKQLIPASALKYSMVSGKRHLVWMLLCSHVPTT